MRIVFMGTPEFALPSLRILLENGYEVPAVVTAPDKPRGRGQKVSSTPIKEFAQNHKLTILQPENLRDSGFLKSLTDLEPDLCVVVAFRILPKEVFTIPPNGTFNLHASLLPRFRGAAPIQWAIIRGEKETGVTTFFLREKVDTGSILLQARVKIGPEETAGELHDKLAEVGAEIVLQTIRLIGLGKVQPRPQDDSLASPAPKIFKEDCKIDWSKSAGEVHNLIRGLSPSPCAWTMHHGTTLKIYRSAVGTQGEESMSPGKVVLVNKESLVVGTGHGSLAILELQQEGKKRLDVEEFLRGYNVNREDVLG
ncbi:MAG: methionyl-tRNA formyltransferase [Bacteroidota bacterium]